MPDVKPQFKIEGMDVLRRRLAELPKKVGKKGQRRAITKATRVLRTATKKNAPRDTGALKRSMSYRIKTYGHADGSSVTVGLVGPRTKITYEIKGKRRHPARYIHLVEKRTGFMRQSLSAVKSELENVIATDLGNFIEAEAAKD